MTTLTIRKNVAMTKTMPTMALRSLCKIASMPYCAMPPHKKTASTRNALPSITAKSRPRIVKVGDHRRPQRVLQRHLPLAVAEGPGKLDERLLEALHHVGAGEARRLPHASEGERDGGEDQMDNRIEEGRELAGDQRIDGIEPGHRGRRLHSLAQASDYGQKIEREGEQKHQEDRPHERRRHNPQEGDDASDVVGHGIAMASRKNPQGNAGQNHEQARIENELERRGKELGEVGDHRPVGVEREAEVAFGQALEEVVVLSRNGIVEVEPISQSLDHLRCRGRAERDARRISRHDSRQKEDDDRYADEHDDRGEQSSREVGADAHGNSPRQRGTRTSRTQPRPTWRGRIQPRRSEFGPFTTGLRSLCQPPTSRSGSFRP